MRYFEFAFVHGVLNRLSLLC